MVTVTETAAKKISELKLEEGKSEWLLRHVLRARLGRTAGPRRRCGRGAGRQGLHRQAQRALSGRQRDRLRRQQHDGRRLRDQEPEREVELRLRPVSRSEE